MLFYFALSFLTVCVGFCSYLQPYSVSVGEESPWRISGIGCKQMGGRCWNSQAFKMQQWVICKYSRRLQQNSGVPLSWYCSFTALLSMDKCCMCLVGLSCYLLPDGAYNKCNEIRGSHQIDIILPCFMKILKCGLRRSMGSWRLSVMHGSSENFKRFNRKKVLLKYLRYF